MAGRLAPGFCEWRMFIAITGGEPNKEQHSPLLLTAKSNGWCRAVPSSTAAWRTVTSTCTTTNSHWISYRIPERCRRETSNCQANIWCGLPRCVASLGLAMVFIDFFFTTAGVLSCLDGYMNIALEQTEEHANGRVTNRYGDAFIRGNNGASLFCLQDVLFWFAGSAVYLCCGGAVMHTRRNH